MQRRKIRLIEKSLTTLQWCFVVAAVWVLVKATVLRDSLPQPALATATEAPSTQEMRESAAADDLAAIWQRDLHQELIPKPPEKKAEPKAPPPPPQVVLPKLLATFVENGKSWGLFVESGGAQRIRSVSDTVDGFMIAAIVPGEATLGKSGRTYQVEIPRPQSEQGRKLTSRRN